MSPHHRQFWAKTPPADLNATMYKPVAHHLLDVAAVATALLQGNPARLDRDCGLTGLAGETHVQLCALLAALHDLGKISQSFQLLSRDHWPSSSLGAFPDQGVAPISHWEATALLLAAEPVTTLLANAGLDGVLTHNLVAAVAGHHGRSPGSARLNASPYDAGTHCGIGRDCVNTAAALVADLLAVLPIGSTLPDWIKHDAAFSFALNGLITVADWIGSGPHFTFEPPEMPLTDYWALAQGRARAAVVAAGLDPVRPVDHPSLSGIVGAPAAPRPMQAAAGAVCLAGGPQLFLLEDGTGTGKTEAGALLAARMMAAGRGEGLVFLLPTMATANAMHRRLAAAMPGLFEEAAGRRASLVLAHGKAKIAGALASLGRQPADSGESSAAARINQWIADSRKKAFFADVGAGTIDQAFLAVLPKKHLTLRHYALAGRILIIDEAHAYDAYMGEELKTLLHLHAMLGGSAIVLSATLPLKKKRELVAAFAEGAGMKDGHGERRAMKDGIGAGAYPLLTHFGEGTTREIAVDSSPDQARNIAVARLGSRHEAIASALSAAGKGAAVAIICNAVDEAIGMHAALAAALPAGRAHLFHARFLMGDRLRIEQAAMARFGRDSAPGQRAGHVIVATQVIEQSLDLDFDLIISDLAPVDLVIQRAGRLWRHQRPCRPLPAPVIQIISPEPGNTVDAGWLDDTLGAAAHVYKLPAVMWRSARQLFGEGRIVTPEGLRPMIEAVYGETPEPIPQGMEQAQNAGLGKDYGAIALARNVTIDPKGGYASVTVQGQDEEIGTRLGEHTQTLRLATRTNGTLQPLFVEPQADEALNWALSEISVRTRWLGDVTPRDGAAVDLTRRTWPEWEQSIVLLEVDATGQVLSIESNRKTIYQSTIGLVHCPRRRGDEPFYSENCS